MVVAASAAGTGFDFEMMTVMIVVPLLEVMISVQWSQPLVMMVKDPQSRAGSWSLTSSSPGSPSRTRRVIESG